MRASWVALCAAVVVARASAHGQEVGESQAPRGRVLRVDQDLLVTDLVGEGLAAGQRVRLLRPLEVRHPLTGAVLRDRYVLGEVTLHSAGERLSVARVSQPLLRPPRTGDEVEPVDGLPRPPPRPTVAPRPASAQATETVPRTAPARPPTQPLLPPPSPGDDPPRTVAPAPPPRPDPDDEAVIAAWRGTLGVPPEARVARWAQFLAQHPRTRHDASVRGAIAQLQADLTASAPPPPPPEAPREDEVGRTVGIPDLTLGDPARFAMQVTHPAVRARGTLYVRRPGAEAYESVPLVAQGDRFVVGEVPSRYVALEGFEYFVGLEGDGGLEVTVMGASRTPRRVSVTRRDDDLPARGDRTRIDLRGEYADVGSRTVNAPAGPRFRAQRFYLVEGDFFQRLEVSFLYGYRVGFGVYEGEGVSLASVDTDVASARSTVIYGYHELEFEIVRALHVMVRGALGVHGEGIVGGAQLRLRIGEERRTNLVLGGDLFNQIGQRAFFALNVNAHPRVPLLAQAEVFNQSFSGGDPMFRFIAQVGVRATSWLTIAARGSYQLRNIQNGGFGGGLSTTFHW
jgi:hypothetical protein